MSIRRVGLVAAVSALVVPLGACGGPDDDGEITFDDILAHARAAGADRQVAVLEGGGVSAETIWTFEAGLDECYRAQGVWVDESVVSPVDGWSLVRDSSYDGLDVENDTVLIDALNACADEWDISFLQLAYEVTHGDVMAEPLLRWMRECLTDAGLEVTGAERSAADFARGDVAEGGRAGVARTCLAEGVAELYPDLPSYTVAW